MASRGGKREGAGRKAGSLSKKTRAIAEVAFEQGITPLEVMLKVMRDFLGAGHLEAAADVAKDAAPYVHPKLSSVEHTGADGEAIKLERIERVIVDPTNQDC